MQNKSAFRTLLITVSIINASIITAFIVSTSSLAGSGDLKDEPLTFATVQKLIKTHKIKRIEDLLPLLPEQYRSKFTLIYKSESAQGASVTQPRVILFGNSGDPKSPQKAQLIMALTGDPKLNGGQILETIEFNPDQKNFVFRSVDFSGKKPVIHENPAQCMKCHSKSLHPNWDTYSLWPGAIAGNHLGINGLHPETERQVIKNFLSTAADHDRYKHLKLSTELSAPKYPEALKELDGNNSHLTRLLTRYNSERILTEIASAPEFPKYKEAFEAALSNTSDFLAKLPDPKSAKLQFEERLAETKKKAEAYLKERSDRYIKNTSVDPTAHQILFDLDERDLDAVARLRLLAEDYLKIPTRDWPMTRFPDTYAFMGPDGGVRIFKNIWGANPEEFLRIGQLRNQAKPNCSNAIVDSISGLTTIKP